ncbi:protein phosphatase 2C domain-containing protein [Alkalihalobacillus sp. MEB203]|uniref:Protein phosphatase 2C domain-containing protein n=2 Tax=Alkalihalobacterium chitinilyticum TaxID=2980103 RepID=A0ABT5VKT2_9BACI|nr:protein phosphatase 2C domain-containing protein [Alkalihalobacterium chitinilyticum]
MSNNPFFSWVGSQETFVDEINIRHFEHVVLGRFGGNSSAGQYKNEDACTVWVDKSRDLEFVVLLDAHDTAESAELVLNTIRSLKDDLLISLTFPIKETFKRVSNILLETFESSHFKKACQKTQGETAFLCVVRKEKYIWWLSVGDCVLHLNHPELAILGEYQQNQRSFYEWIGKTNTFDLEVPCYSMGTKELRQGKSHLLLTTDGLIECPNGNYNDPREIFRRFESSSNEQGVLNLLTDIKEKNVRDSTTILSWMVDSNGVGALPSG